MIFNNRAILFNKSLALKKEAKYFEQDKIKGCIWSFITVNRRNYIIFFFITRGSNANLTLAISVFIVLFILGIIFSILSKKLWFVIAGIVLKWFSVSYRLFPFVRSRNPWTVKDCSWNERIYRIKFMLESGQIVWSYEGVE